MTRRVEFPAESATSIGRFAPLIFALKRFEELTRMPILRKIQTHRAHYLCPHCAPVSFEPKVSIFDNSTIERAISHIIYDVRSDGRTSLTFVYLGSINYILTFLYVLLHSFTAWRITRRVCKGIVMNDHCNRATRSIVLSLEFYAN